MKQKAIFFIVPSCSKDAWLDKKMMQITEAFISMLNSHDKFPVVKITQYSELNQYMDKAELLFVLRAGSVICNPSVVLNKLKSVPSTVGLIGHILKTYETETPYLHDQMFIIRTSAFKELMFSSPDDIGLDIVRSEEDLHDGRAPLYVTLGNNFVERKHKFGTKLLVDCLNNGYEARNFDNEWRWNQDRDSNFVSLDGVNDQLSNFKLDLFPVKGYCYPEKNTELFSKALKSLELIPGLDSSQEIFIASFRQALKFKILNALTFDVSYDVPLKETSICPATGFLGEVTAIKAKSSKLIFYDKNPNNINFKKDLYQYWDGKNYKNFVDNWVRGKDLKLEPIFEVNYSRKELAYQQAEELLFPIWDTWKKQTAIEFKLCDLISDFDQLVDVDASTSLLYTSTILDDYPITHVVHDLEKIEEIKNKIIARGLHWLN